MSRMSRVARVGRVARAGGGAAFSPLTVSNLAVWFTASPLNCFSDAGGTVPSTDGGVVQVWKDRSGNARDVSQATGTAQPTLNLVSGRWQVTFDGTDDALTRASGAWNASADGAAFAVLTPVDTLSVRRYFNAGTIWRLGQNGGPAQWTFPAVIDLTTAGNYFTDATRSLISWRVQPASGGEARLNATTQETPAGVGATSSANQALAVGSGSGAQFWKGAIHELLVFTSGVTQGVSQTDRDAIEAYLKSAWGL